MRVVKKILFPFFKERHRFLLDKWWFRLLIVGYIVAFVISPFLLFHSFLDSAVGWCWNSVTALAGDSDKFREMIETRSQIHAEARPESAIVALIVFIVGHYAIQLIVFKIAVDFVALGPAKENGPGVAS